MRWYPLLEIRFLTANPHKSLPISRRCDARVLGMGAEHVRVYWRERLS